MSGSHVPKMPTAKSSSDDKGSVQVVMTEGLDKAENDLDSAMVLAPVRRDELEPVVTRRELWSYYSMFSYRLREDL